MNQLYKSIISTFKASSRWKVLEARRHSRRSSGLPVTIFADVVITFLLCFLNQEVADVSILFGACALAWRAVDHSRYTGSGGRWDHAAFQECRCTCSCRSGREEQDAVDLLVTQLELSRIE